MPEGRRLALVIAASDFKDPTFQKLVTPGLDAARLAQVLRNPQVGNFEVNILINRPASELLREIEAFFAGGKKDDLIVLYFSGHGVKDDDGRLYLATTDTRRGLFRSTAIPATFINESMTASRSRRQVLILDCCHSGAFARGMVAKGGESMDLHDQFEGRGRVVLTASNATQYAFQGDAIFGQGQQSVFTRHLVRGMESGEADRDGDGWVSLDELYDYVYDRVVEETPHQTPGKWTFDLQGDILISSNPRSAHGTASETHRSTFPSTRAESEEVPSRDLTPEARKSKKIARSKTISMLVLIFGLLLSCGLGAGIFYWSALIYRVGQQDPVYIGLQSRNYLGFAIAVLIWIAGAILSIVNARNLWRQR